MEIKYQFIFMQDANKVKPDVGIYKWEPYIFPANNNA